MGWTWTEVQLRTRVNKVNYLEPLAALGSAQLICLPKLSHQEWPTVAMLCGIRFSTIRAHLNRRLREGPRRLPDVGSMSSSPSSPSSVTTQSEAKPNPLVQVFDELHGELLITYLFLQLSATTLTAPFLCSAQGSCKQLKCRTNFLPWLIVVAQGKANFSALL